MLFSLADSTLYKVKQNGKNGSMIYCVEGETDLAGNNDIKQEFARIVQIVEGRHGRGGALALNLEQFSLIYRFIKQFYKRYGGMTVELMFILTDEEGVGGRSYSLKDAADKFSLCLQDTLRKSDMILRYKPNQFFVIMQNLSDKDFPLVLSRIMDAWEAGEHHMGIHIEYLMDYVIYEKEIYEK